MGYECKCESENVYECEPNTRTDPCRGCQVHSFVSRSSLQFCQTLYTPIVRAEFMYYTTQMNKYNCNIIASE